MKFINYLEKISGVDIYALTSFTVFALFFIVMLTWVFRADKNTIREISRIPLDKEEI